jgi:hypothetical protein
LERLETTGRKHFFLLLVPQNILRILELTFAQTEIAMLCEKHFIGIESSLQTSGFVKCFIRQNYLTILVTAIPPCYSFEF